MLYTCWHMASKSRKKYTKQSKLELATLRVARTGFAFVGIYMATIIILDSWNLLTKEAVGRRWLAAGLLLIINGAVWYLARHKASASYYNSLVMTLVIAQILFASLNIYWERGMASIMAILFVVPILTAGALKKRTALLGAATFSAAGYSMAAVSYFFNNYGEGYRIQLWGQVFFFGALFFVIAWLAMILAGLRHDSE